MKSMCMFCGEEHKNKTPEICSFKSAISSALMKAVEAEAGMYILDRTSFLSEVELAYYALEGKKKKGKKK